MKRIVSWLLVVMMSCSMLIGCGKSAGVKTAEEAINNIGEVTLSSKDAIDTATRMYEILTDNEKATVDNRATLVTAKAQYEKLVADEEARIAAEEEKKRAEEEAAAEEARRKAEEEEKAAQKKAEEEAKKAEEEAKKVAKQYYDNMTIAHYKMLLGAILAEEACGLIHSVWVNAIYKDKDEKTDPYTRPNGRFVDDFNDALQNLFGDETFSSSLSSIRDNMNEVAELMRQLKTPPEEYKEAYNVLNNLYQSYLDLCNSAVNPSGNITTYTSTYNAADNEFLKYYNALKLYLE